MIELINSGALAETILTCTVAFMLVWLTIKLTQ